MQPRLQGAVPTKEKTIILGSDKVRLVSQGDGKIKIVIERDCPGTEGAIAFIAVTGPQLDTLLKAIALFAKKHL